MERFHTNLTKLQAVELPKIRQMTWASVSWPQESSDLGLQAWARGPWEALAAAKSGGFADRGRLG